MIVFIVISIDSQMPTNRKEIYMNKKRLYKSSRNKKICGVCGGIAEYLNMDPTVVRLITAIIALAWGSGIILYIIMAFVMPYDNEITY